MSGSSAVARNRNLFTTKCNTMIIRSLGLYLKYLQAKIKYLGKVKFNGFTVLYAFRGSKIDIGTGTVFNSHPLSNLVGLNQRMIMVARHGGTIKIGEGCQISGSTIYAMESIALGRNVYVGGNCKIIDNDFHPLAASKRISQKPEDISKRPITIGDDCFIGANSFILKGTSLGRNCVVGAGSVVSGTWPDNSIIAGNPARLIRKNEE